jgi:hypothetical protein
MSWWAWIIRAASGANQFILSKDQTLGTDAGWLFLIDNGGGEGSIRLLIHRATDTDYITAAGTIVQDEPTFIFATYDDAASSEVRIWKGTDVSPAAEITSGFITSTNGSGSHDPDTTASLYAGNIQRGGTTPLLGQMMAYGIAATPITNLDLIHRVQRDPRVIPPSCRLLCRPGSQGGGSSTVLDESGQRNHGTITSATYAEVRAINRGSRRANYSSFHTNA